MIQSSRHPRNWRWSVWSIPGLRVARKRSFPTDSISPTHVGMHLQSAVDDLGLDHLVDRLPDLAAIGLGIDDDLDPRVGIHFGVGGQRRVAERADAEESADDADDAEQSLTSASRPVACPAQQLTNLFVVRSWHVLGEHGDVVEEQSTSADS